MKTKTTLRDLYRFPGFRARATLKSHPEDPEECMVTLERRQKNSLFRLRYNDIKLSGPANSSGARPGCRINSHLSCVRVSPGCLPALQSREARDPLHVGQVSPIHAAVRRPHWTALSRDEHPTCCGAQSPELGSGVSHGEALHASPIGAASAFFAASDHWRR